MKNELFFLILLLLLFQKSIGQEHIYKTIDSTEVKTHLTVASNFSYIWQSNNTQPSAVLQKEYVWSSYLELPIKNFRVGSIYHKIWAWGIVNGKQNYSLVGGLIKYYYPIDEKINGFFGLQYLRGNYCTCGIEPFKIEGLNYVGFSLGLEYQIWKSLYIDIGFENNNITNAMAEKYGYNRYILGLKYHLKTKPSSF